MEPDVLSDSVPQWRYGWRWVAVLLAAVAPLAALAFFAAPQTDDFCYGAIVQQHGLAGIVEHYRNWSGRVVASGLIPLPMVVADHLGVDLFRIYGLFAAAFLFGFAMLCFWLIGALLPQLANPARLFFAVALFIAMVANAPTTRHMIFWMPGAFTYTLPTFVLLVLFTSLYRALAERRWIARGQFVAMIPILLLASLCNELTGPIAAAMLAASLLARRRLAFEHPEATDHAILLAAVLAATAVVYLAPGNLVRGSTLHGNESLLGAVLWGTLYVPAFFGLHLIRPGVVGWLLLLAVQVASAPAVPADKQSVRARCGFTAVSLLAGCWLSFVAGYYAQGTRLPARALNLLFALSVLCLSYLLKDAAARWGRSLSTEPWSAATVERLRRAGTGLLLLSPAVLGAVWQLPQAPAFRREARAQVLAISDSPLPIPQVHQIETTPQLLFNNRLVADGTDWPNRCLARYYGKQAVIPIP